MKSCSRDIYAGNFLEHADGAIVGTSLKTEGIVTNPVDPDRVRRLTEIFESMK